MINSLELTNFQSHDSSKLDFDPGVNVIVGQSDAGKSAILRGLFWFAKNKPGGLAHVSDWIKTKKGAIKKGETCSVTIVKDGKTAVRYRNEKNGYSVEKKVLDAIGSDIPPEVDTFLNMGDVNIQRQMDAPFLISSTPGEVSRFFNKLVNLEAIDIGLGLIGSKKRATNASIGVKEKDIEDKIEQLEEYKWVTKATKSMKALDKVAVEKVALHKRINDLAELLEKVNGQSKILESTGKITAVGDRLDEATALHSTLLSQSNDMAKLSSVVVDVERCGKTLKEAEKLLAHSKDVDHLQELAASHTDEDNMANTLMRMISEIGLWDRKLNNSKSFSVETAEKRMSNVTKLQKSHESVQKDVGLLETIYNRVTELTALVKKSSSVVEFLEEELPDTCPYCNGAM